MMWTLFERIVCELSAFNHGGYVALFSASEQTHFALNDWL